jgi:surface antigen
MKLRARLDFFLFFRYHPPCRDCTVFIMEKTMNLRQMLVMGVASLSLVACQQQPGQDFMGNPTTSSGGVSKQTLGTLGGAALGGVLGSKVGKGTGKGVAIGVGTLLGAAMGSSVGSSLDRADMQYYGQTSQRALETAQPGQALPWSNPQSGNSGSVTPYNYYQMSDGSYCREYSQTINVGGQIQKGFGKACRQADGTWRIVQ